MEKYLEDMLIIGFLIFKGPTRLEYEASFFGQDREFAIGVEFERGIGGIDLAEEKKSLLRRYLVRKRDRIRKRYVDMSLGGKEGVEKTRIVLEERLLDAPRRLREEGEC